MTKLPTTLPPITPQLLRRGLYAVANGEDLAGASRGVRRAVEALVSQRLVLLDPENGGYYLSQAGRGALEVLAGHHAEQLEVVDGDVRRLCLLSLDGVDYQDGKVLAGAILEALGS